MLIGAHTRFRGNRIGTRRLGRVEAELREEAIEILSLVGLGGQVDEDVRRLSYGQGRLLEVARAIIGRPRVIMLDEPAAGLAPAELEQLGEIIRWIGGQGIAVLLIEHDMNFLLPLAHRAVVLNFGRKIADGTPEEVCADREVIDAYLGTAVRSQMGLAEAQRPQSLRGLRADRGHPRACARSRDRRDRGASWPKRRREIDADGRDRGRAPAAFGRSVAR